MRLDVLDYSELSVVLTQHCVSDLCALDPLRGGDVHRGGGLCVIQSVMLNHTKTATPRRDLFGIVPRERLCFGAH